MKMRAKFPLGGIASLIIFIYTVQADIWSKIGGWWSWLFGLAFVLLFLADFEYTRKETPS